LEACEDSVEVVGQLADVLGAVVGLDWLSYWKACALQLERQEVIEELREVGLD
jgi:uncharacterized membrane protein